MPFGQIKPSFGAAAGQNASTCLVPALCPSCKEVLSSEYQDSFPICPACSAAILLYDEARLYKEDSSSDSAAKTTIFSCELTSGDIFRLFDCTYLCPKCGSHGLRFSITGYWE